MAAKAGERFGGLVDADCRYFKHAADGALADGDPCDAGSLMIIDQNLSHQAHEGVYQWASESGPETIGGTDDPSGYDAVTGGGISPPRAPTDTGSGAHKYIAWNRQTSRHYGPNNLILDRAPTTVVTTGGRGVRVVVQTVTAAGIQLAAAITPDGVTPWDGDLIVWSGWVTVASGTQTTTIDLIPDGNVVRLQQRWRYASSGAVGSESIVIPVLLWVGWYSEDDDNLIASISAWESREI